MKNFFFIFHAIDFPRPNYTPPRESVEKQLFGLKSVLQKRENRERVSEALAKARESYAFRSYIYLFWYVNARETVFARNVRNGELMLSHYRWVITMISSTLGEEFEVYEHRLVGLINVDCMNKLPVAPHKFLKHFTLSSQHKLSAT